MKPLLLIGLPRSGTTIVSNYLNSASSSLILIEPHLQYSKYGDRSFLNEVREVVARSPGISRFSRTPMDKIFKCLAEQLDVVGFKETYRCNGFKKYDKKLPNETLIKNYQSKGYVIVPILRNPLDIWNSLQRRRKPVDYKHWSEDVSLFLDNLDSFSRLANGMPGIDYDRFVSNPNDELYSVLKDSAQRIDTILPRKTTMGDDIANESVKVKKIQREVYYSKEDAETILNSDAYTRYQGYSRNVV